MERAPRLRRCQLAGVSRGSGSEQQSCREQKGADGGRRQQTEQQQRSDRRPGDAAAVASVRTATVKSKPGDQREQGGKRDNAQHPGSFSPTGVALVSAVTPLLEAVEP